MTLCPWCSKQNQDHYKFCLGCGGELPRKSASMAPKRPSVRPVKTKGVAAVEVAEAPAAVAEAALQTEVGGQSSPGAASAPCPQCGMAVPAGFKFCGGCGSAMAGAQAAPPAAASPVAGGDSAAGLVLVNPDGTEGERVPLAKEATPVGRKHGALFATDAYLSPLHAVFAFKGDVLHVHDENSLNGVYVKIDREVPVPLEHGSMFRIGQEILRFEALAEPQLFDGVELMGGPNPGYIGRLCSVMGRNPAAGDAYPILPQGIFLGRERGDVLFPEDGYVSALHCSVRLDAGQVVLTDLGSSNGTFLRIRNERALRSGDLLLMGQQLFRVSY